MKRLIIAAAALTLMTGVAVATTDTGTIKQIDPKSDAITLDDGNTFTLAEGTEAESLKVGQKVTVTYSLEGWKNGGNQNCGHEIAAYSSQWRGPQCLPSGGQIAPMGPNRKGRSMTAPFAEPGCAALSRGWCRTGEAASGTG